MSDETFSAALIANLVAGNLQHVDDSMIDRNALGPARKINPKKFLPSQVLQAEAAQTQEHEQRLMNELNRQALQTHPHSSEAVIQTQMQPQTPQRVTVNTNTVKTEEFTEIVKVFKSIDTTLKKIAKHIVDSK